MNAIYSSKVLSVRELAPGLRFLALARPAGLTWLAGQGIALELPTESAGTRVYSIANAPDTADHLELVVDIARRGLGPAYVSRLNVGDIVRFRAPVGDFALEKAPGAPVAFIACGLGVVPIRAMAQRLLRYRLAFPVRLHHFVKDLHQQIFRNEFVTEVFRREDFEYEVLFDIPVAEYIGGRYVDAPARRDWRFYVCGPREEASTAWKVLLEGGYSHEAVRCEAW